MRSGSSKGLQRLEYVQYSLTISLRWISQRPGQGSSATRAAASGKGYRGQREELEEVIERKAFLEPDQNLLLR